MLRMIAFVGFCLIQQVSGASLLDSLVQPSLKSDIRVRQIRQILEMPTVALVGRGLVGGACRVNEDCILSGGECAPNRATHLVQGQLFRPIIVQPVCQEGVSIKLDRTQTSDFICVCPTSPFACSKSCGGLICTGAPPCTTNANDTMQSNDHGEHGDHLSDHEDETVDVLPNNTNNDLENGVDEMEAPVSAQVTGESTGAPSTPDPTKVDVNIIEDNQNDDVITD